MREKVRRFFRTGVALSLSALLMRTVSVSFGAYVAECIGAEGMGLYSLIMSVYTFAVTFATSGVQLGVTRLVSEALGREKPQEARAALSTALWYALFFGAVASFSLLLGADFFGMVLLGDRRTVPALRLLSVALIPIALSSVFSGYFIAVRKATRGAAVSVAEQLLRILLTVGALTVLLPKGLSYACLALVGGSALAEIFSALCLFFLYLLERRQYKKEKASGRQLFPLLRITLPVAASSYVRSGLVSAEHMLIPRSLAAGGQKKEEALASYGVLSGMAMPLLLYPSAILTSFAGLLIPEVAERVAREAAEENRRLCERALFLTLIFGIGFGGIFAAFAENIGLLVYGKSEVGRYIAILAPIVPIMYLDHITDAMLKGAGRQVFSMTVNILDSVGSILLVVLLLPSLGADGYAYIIMIAELFNFSFSITGLHNAIPFRFRPFSWLLLPTVSILLSVTLAGRLIAYAGAWWLLAKILLSVLFYLLLLCLFGWAKRIAKKRKSEEPSVRGKGDPLAFWPKKKRRIPIYRFSFGNPPSTLDKGEKDRYNEDRGKSPTIL